MTLHAFWALHADAVGAALVAAAAAVVAIYFIVRRYDRLARGQRAVDRAMRARDRKIYGERLRAILDAQPGGLDEYATQAIRVGVRTPLMEASGDLTMETPRDPYAPLPYDGMAVAR
jgi:hypothetical protein